MLNGANHFRRQRFARFIKLVDRVASQNSQKRIRIIDLGGTRDYWERLAPFWHDRPVNITVVNVNAQNEQRDRIEVRSGNACALPDLDSNSFDVVHSNSVIEHVGHWDQMTSMAREVRRLAPSYFLQTPNVWFPVEMHFNLPFIHWLPEQMRAAILLAPKGRFLPVDSTLSNAMNLVQRVNLLSARQLCNLFPDALIERERFMLLTKSLIAIREG